jgi:hypothetical protein
VKLAGFFSVMLAIGASAQSAQYGTRIGQIQTAYIDEKARANDFVIIRDGSKVLTPPPASDMMPRAEFETWVEQRYRDYAESVLTGFTSIEREGGKTTVRRFVRDNFHQTDLTYKMTLEVIPGTKTFRAVFNDSPLPYPDPQILREGETIALILASDARTGRRLVDYIRVGTGIMKPRQGVARDIYADDAELTITRPRLRTNGVEQQTANLPATLSAPVVWVYIPGQGRYALSFKPRADQGFERAGEVSENSLVFSLGGNIFRIDCADRIATGSGTYNIYARKDPAQDPPDDPTRVTLGAQR